MIRASRVHAANGYAREYGAAVVSAALIYSGIKQVVSVLKYIIPSSGVWFINFVIRTGFRDHIGLDDRGGAPWRFTAITFAGGVMTLVLGVFVGLWLNSRKQRRPIPALPNQE